MNGFLYKSEQQQGKAASQSQLLNVCYQTKLLRCNMRQNSNKNNNKNINSKRQQAAASAKLSFKAFFILKKKKQKGFSCYSTSQPHCDDRVSTFA